MDSNAKVLLVPENPNGFGDITSSSSSEAVEEEDAEFPWSEGLNILVQPIFFVLLVFFVSSVACLFHYFG